MPFLRSNSKLSLLRKPIFIACLALITACGGKEARDASLPTGFTFSLKDLNNEVTPEGHCYTSLSPTSSERARGKKSKLGVAIDINEDGDLQIYRSDKAFSDAHENKDAAGFVKEFRKIYRKDTKNGGSFLPVTESHLDMKEFKGHTQIYFILYDNHWTFQDEPFFLNIDTEKKPEPKDQFFEPINYVDSILSNDKKVVAVNYHHISFNKGRTPPLLNDCEYKYDLHVNISNNRFETKIIIDPIIKNTGLP